MQNGKTRDYQGSDRDKTKSLLKANCGLVCKMDIASKTFKNELKRDLQIILKKDMRSAVLSKVTQDMICRVMLLTIGVLNEGEYHVY